MKVIKPDPLLSISKLKNKEEFVNQLMQQVICICREDKTITINSKIKKLNEYKNTLLEKDNKLNILLEKSNKIKEGIQKQLIEINEDNLRLQERLINQLGSEL